MSDTWDPWDDTADDDHAGADYGGDLAAALDFSESNEQQQEIGIASESNATPDTDDLSPLFSVGNLSGTVTVTAAIDGSVHDVDLDPAVTKLTERELAEEIRVVADLARQKALSVAHARLVEGMRESGYDASAISASLTRGLGMPTPEQASEATAREFARRYSDDPAW